MACSDDRRVRRTGEKYERQFRDFARAVLNKALALALRQDELAQSAWTNRYAASDASALVDAMDVARAQVWPLYVATHGESKARIDLGAPPYPRVVTAEQLYECREATWQALLHLAAKNAAEDHALAELDLAEQKALSGNRHLGRNDATRAASQSAASHRLEAHLLWNSYSLELNSMLRVAAPELGTWLIRAVGGEFEGGDMTLTISGLNGGGILRLILETSAGSPTARFGVHPDFEAGFEKRIVHLARKAIIEGTRSTTRSSSRKTSNTR